MNEARKEGNTDAIRIPRPEAADARPPRHGHGGGPAPVGAGRHGRHEHRAAVQRYDASTSARRRPRPSRPCSSRTSRWRRGSAGPGPASASTRARRRQACRLAIPLIAKGRGEAREPGSRDINYFLGIDETTEHDRGGLRGSRWTTGNPSGEPRHHGDDHDSRRTTSGTTLLPPTTGHVFTVYLDGVDGGPRSIVGPRLLRTSLNRRHHLRHRLQLGDTRRPAGFFAGAMDETRIWNVARSQAQIQASMNTEIAFPTAGLARSLGDERGHGNGYDRRLHRHQRSEPWLPRRLGLRAPPHSNPAAPGANASLAFNGLNQYVDMGTRLQRSNTPTWTVETWFKQTNNGTKAASGTGNGGLADVDPAHLEGSRRGRKRRPPT